MLALYETEIVDMPQVRLPFAMDAKRADAGGEDGGGEGFAKIDNFCVKVDIMGRDRSRVEGK